MNINDLTKEDENNLIAYQNYAEEQGITLEALLLYLILKDKEGR